MAKSSSKKRSRAADEDVAEAGNGINGEQTVPIVKKSKIDESGKAEITKSDTPSKKDKKKEKKDKKDKEGKKEKKEKKTKEVDEDEEQVEEESKEDKKSKNEKKDKKKTKDKKSKTKDIVSEGEDVAMENGATEGATVANGAETPSKRSKKDKKDKKEKNSKKEKKATAVDGDDDEEEPSADTNADPDTSSKANRFICFVGNLPFTATADAVKQHFAKVQPMSVRLLTERNDPSKSRGIAFVEFANFDHMKTCLEKFHHSEFNDGKSAPRKINVELTAGGGGKTSYRQEKIASKNKKLNEERHNRFVKEEEAKLERSKEKALEEPQQQQQEAGWIHPSRLGFVPHENQTQEQRDEAAAQLAKTEGTWNGSGGKFRSKNNSRGGGRGGRGGGRGGSKFRGRR
ncbi:hypothetical protein QBC34DRAFT_397296 [Podospora aff. communis PSN243]|uniref:RRM domain-containing protein n=1 Tax=Podospora aff. communis PSN243 TaxID=3040156 RepID=A0AAV9GY69_9PEZI|nr:hypothetical protein QBC34DRAFT_397296 [Podospora aff. communis PSN243]